MAALLVACALAACTSPQRVELESAGTMTASLAGSRWVLQRLGSDLVPAAPLVTLDFSADARIQGSDGCNRYTGSVAVDAGTIRFGSDLAGTMMACPGEIDARSRAYHTALRDAARYRVDDGRLSLLDAGGRALAVFAPADLTLVGVQWDVLAYNNGRQAVTSLIRDTQISASFGVDGRISGHAGCNRYFAPYTLAGDALTIGSAGATRMACAEPAGLMQQEALFLAALATVATWRIDGDRLELRTAQGALAVSLRRNAGATPR
jgi:heat shock protein HslJ